MPHSREAPDADGNCIPQARPQSVHKPAHEEQSQRVRGLKRGDDIAVLDLIPTKNFLQVRREQAEYLSIHIVDGGRKEQQSADTPAIIPASTGLNGGPNRWRRVR